ncbi:MAG: DUF1016 domain-containing protein [Gammaproteobacteria bacterium]|nr:DUF1016 domain-containing protein [Gammaproteobacteria bacterium]
MTREPRPTPGVAAAKRKGHGRSRGTIAEAVFASLRLTSSSTDRRTGTMANRDVERTTEHQPGSEEREAALATAISDVDTIVNAARSSASRSVNAALTSAYWLLGQRIVEFEHSGQERAEYGSELIARLADELTAQFGRGFSRQNLQYIRQFLLSFAPGRIGQTPSGISARSAESQNRQTPSGESDALSLVDAFSLPWPPHVRLLPVS